jgi:membrane associated rhomboid family serine protease
MSYGLNEDQDYPRITPGVKWLIDINVAIAFLGWTIVNPQALQIALGFQASDFQNKQWWSLVTYMFAHGGVMHLAVNMYMLWIFGPRLEHSWGTPSFTRLYLFSGLGGLAAHLLMSSLGMAGGGVLIGASAAVMGIMYAYAASWPEQEIFFFGVIPMKVKWMMVLLITLNLVSGIASMDAAGGVAYFAHLGGIAFAWLFVRLPSAASLDRIRHRVSPVPEETDEPPRAVPRSLPRNRERMSEIDEIVAKSNAIAARRNSAVLPPRKEEAGPAADALDHVLDKISERGLESLTVAERKLLEDMSRELRRGS